MKTKTIIRALIALGAYTFGSMLYAAPAVWISDPKPFPAVEESNPVEPGVLPRLIERQDVKYPASLLAQPVNDRVFVAFSVTAQGEVKKPRPIFGGNEACERAAVESIARWRFEPGQLRGRPVATQMTVEIRFVSEAGESTGAP